MSKVYTFPALKTFSGDYVIKMRDSSGSGSESLTDAYFSKVSPLKQASDLKGGDVLSSGLSLEVEDDVDDFFHSTIFPLVQTPGQNLVDVEILVDGVTEFIGIIEPKSIKEKEWYSTDAGLADGSTHRSVSFQVIDPLSRLKYVPIETWVSSLSPTYTHGTDPEMVKLEDLFSSLMATLESAFGYSITFSESIKIYFTAFDHDGGWYYAFNDSLDVTVKESLNVSYKSASVITNLFTDGDPPPSPSFFALQNCAEALGLLLRSTGCIAKISYSDYQTFSISIINRDDDLEGTERSLGTILSSEKDTVAEEYIDSVAISADGGDKTYTALSSSVKLSEHQETCLFVINPSISNGNEVLNNQGIPTGEVYWGKDFLESGGYSWSFSSGVSDTTSHSISVRQFDLTSDSTRTATKRIELVRENVLFNCLIFFDGTASSGSLYTLKMQFLDSGSSVLHEFSKNLSYSDLNFYGDSKVLMGLFLQSAFFDDPVFASSVEYVKVSIQAVGVGTSTLTMNMYGEGAFFAELTTQRFLGRKIFKLFGSLWSKFVRVLDGVQDWSLGDFFIQGGQRYFFKSVSKDHMEDETTVEAINYRVQ